MLLLGLLVAACGGAEAPATVERDLPAGAAVRGPDLPGRLLFARQGVIWQWQGREAHPLLGAGEAVQPAWSPDGRRIAYIARSNSFSDLLLADASGAPLSQLTANGSTAPPNSIERVYASRWVFYPTWTPQGTSLIVAAQEQPPAGDPAADYALALTLLATGPADPLTLYSAPDALAGRSAVSPDGAALVFTRAALGPDGRQALYRIAMAGGVPEPLAGAPTPSYDPAFSPDGSWIAFAASDQGRTDIFALPSAGGAPLRLTTQGAARAPAFSPDGTLLAFLAVASGEVGFDLWVADVRLDANAALVAAAPQRITTGLMLDADSGLSWAP